MDIFEELVKRRGAVDISIVGTDYDAPPIEVEKGNLDYLLVHRLGEVFCLMLDYDHALSEEGLLESLGVRSVTPIPAGKWTVKRETSYQEWQLICTGETLYEALDLVRKWSPPPAKNEGDGA